LGYLVNREHRAKPAFHHRVLFLLGESFPSTREHFSCLASTSRVLSVPSVLRPVFIPSSSRPSGSQTTRQVFPDLQLPTSQPDRPVPDRRQVFLQRAHESRRSYPVPAPCMLCTSPQYQCHKSQADISTNYLTPEPLATANSVAIPVAYSADIYMSSVNVEHCSSSFYRHLCSNAGSINSNRAHPCSSSFAKSLFYPSVLPPPS
jgi:hypothetical protein